MNTLTYPINGTPTNLIVNKIMKHYDTFLKDTLPLDPAVYKDNYKAWLAEPDKSKIYVEVFAYSMAAVKQNLGLDLFPTQLGGGLVLTTNAVAEMKTGEGKTVTAIAPVIFNSLTQNVHVISVNDYLTERDYNTTKGVFRLFGLTVGCVTNNTTPYKKRQAYSSNITYITNNELGFDYLRDNMATQPNDRVITQPFGCALIDEIDSILIDEAKTPLIISSSNNEKDLLYTYVNELVSKLQPDMVDVDKTSKTVTLNEAGATFIENESTQVKGDLYSPENTKIMHYIAQSLQAHYIQKRDVDYLLTPERKIELIDASTGRVLTGRRYNDGLHQAIEAKEKVDIQEDTLTGASITYQNLFRLYPKLTGMTGTAFSEKDELKNIYNLNVVKIPTNTPSKRIDHIDKIYQNNDVRMENVIKAITDKQTASSKQPIMVACENVQLAEDVSNRLTALNIEHNLLTAKDHENEADIISRAGHEGAITITTNMAGRGTDIKLVGEGAKNTGLHVIGVGRNRSKRIDDQLRGRAGRQGDLGESQFYISLDDSLLISSNMDRLQAFNKPNVDTSVFDTQMMKNLINQAQRLSEGRDYDTRKQTLEYDDVLREQRELVYTARDKLLLRLNNKTQYPLNLETLYRKCKANNDPMRPLPSQDALKAAMDLSDMSDEEKEAYIREVVTMALSTIDSFWIEHMSDLESLKNAMSYRAYAQTNPLIDYQNEAVELYNEFLLNVRYSILIQSVEMQPSKKEEV